MNWTENRERKKGEGKERIKKKEKKGRKNNERLRERGKRVMRGGRTTLPRAYVRMKKKDKLSK